MSWRVTRSSGWNVLIAASMLRAAALWPSPNPEVRMRTVLTTMGAGIFSGWIFAAGISLLDSAGDFEGNFEGVGSGETGHAGLQTFAGALEEGFEFDAQGLSFFHLDRLAHNAVAAEVGDDFGIGREADELAEAAAFLLALLGVSLVGAFDDWLNARTGIGISARQKLLWQIGVSVISAIYIQQHFAFASLVVPFVGEVPIAPALWIAVAIVAIVSTSNGVNLTDGLDGLSGGTMVFAWISYMVIALLNAPGQLNVAILCALVAGALIGFLWFNIHPASVIIGDSGALGFGAALAVTGLVTGHILLLPLIGIIFVVETGSVILQVASMKLTGRRLFLFTPIHHHFERLGWAETQITFRFWVIGAIGGILGIVTFLATRGVGM